MTRLITTTALALTLAAGTAYAESHSNGAKMEQNLENAGENLENAGENAAQATENAAENAAVATQNAADDAARAIDDAATSTASAVDGMTENDTNMIRARDILGGTIYSANSQDGVAEFQTVTYDSVGEDWDKIGEIEDIVLSSDGKIQGVVAEIGGFLGLGDKHVFLEMDSVKLVPVDDASISLVVGFSEEQLENMKDVDEAFWE
ncbi:PRC-barrel domain-containing protein [Puniceibacterium sediminis]|uniref:PRC-barrel domain-containing protein n=1 Tax=Puniceibacterium sediminis TaxID=1608407 RepID=A0A238W5W3_9RHOB|nr:PRC-barrel domain-containing protein [Puniceibacterium sediminis]SNR41089.1 PRC-barrel domain-containing protein [Puniceibacterium sediminis]